MELSTVYKSAKQLQEFKFDEVDVLFYISLLVSCAVFIFGCIFQFCQFKRLKKKMEFDILNRRQQSLINHYGLTFDSLHSHTYNVGRMGYDESLIEPNQRTSDIEEDEEEDEYKSDHKELLNKTSDIF
jgi:hypothetical protein